MSLTHKQKVKVARNLRSKAEMRAGVSIWSTQGWLQRKQDRRRRVALRNARVRLRRLKRIEARSMEKSPL